MGVWYEQGVNEPRFGPLIRLLQAAYSGERAAELAYRGHWRSVSSPAVREQMREYEAAARLAHRAGYPQWVDCLLEMAEVEWDHEAAFRALVLAHPVGRRLPLWSQPPPRETIRDAFDREPAAGATFAVALSP